MIPAHQKGVGDCWTHFMHSQEPECEQELRAGFAAQKFAPADMTLFLHLARLYLPKVIQPPKTASPKAKCSNMGAQERLFIF